MKVETLKKIQTLAVDQQVLCTLELKQGTKNIGITYLLWFVLGLFGGHHYYLAFQKDKVNGGHLAVGVLYTFTMGVSGLGWMWDFFGNYFYVKGVNQTMESFVLNKYLSEK